MHYFRFIILTVLTSTLLVSCASSKKDTLTTPTDKPVAPIEIQNTNSVNNF